MASIHSWTEEWKVPHSGKPFVELVHIGQAVRADTLALLAGRDAGPVEGPSAGHPQAAHRYRSLSPTSAVKFTSNRD